MKKKTIIIILFILFILIGGGVGFYKYSIWIKDELKNNNSEVFYYDTNDKLIIIEIPSDADFNDVVNILKNNGKLVLKDQFLVNGDWLFKQFAKRKGYYSNINHGTFYLEGKTSISRLIDALMSEWAKKPPLHDIVKLQIPENMKTLDELFDIFEDSLGIEKVKLNNFLLSSDFLENNDLSFQSIPSICIPNTYELYKTENPEYIFNKILDEYNNFWKKEISYSNDSILISRDEHLNILNNRMPIDKKLTRLDISILASIIEEEQDRVISERNMIAGLYLNRLIKGMKLQSDPTVIFAHILLNIEEKNKAIKDLQLKKNEVLKKAKILDSDTLIKQFIDSVSILYDSIIDDTKIKYNSFRIKRVLNRHLEYDSEYNTYIYYGLPPGPICIPSIKSIDAVLNSIDHEYIFMCAKGDSSGRHNFAITYEQHRRNQIIFKRRMNFK